jgi:hypothetical protein
MLLFLNEGFLLSHIGLMPYSCMYEFCIILNCCFNIPCKRFEMPFSSLVFGTLPSCPRIKRGCQGKTFPPPLFKYLNCIDCMQKESIYNCLIGGETLLQPDDDQFCFTFSSFSIRENFAVDDVCSPIP